MQGIYVALVSAFDRQGRPNPTAQAALMERNLREGADGFFLGGSSAECFLLTEAERIELFEAAAPFAARTDLIAHVGAISTAEAIRYAKRAAALGYQHIAATPPFYYGFDAAQVAQYYYDIADAAGMPVMIYNFPGNTNRPFDLANPVTQALFRSDAIFGVKHTNRDLSQLERIRNLNPKLTVMNGYDETMAGGLALGAHGSIGSTFNFTMVHFRKLYDAYKAGDGARALELQVKANNVMDGLVHVGLIPGVKYALQRQGNDCGDPRRPFMPLTPEQQAYLDAVLDADLVR